MAGRLAAAVRAAARCAALLALALLAALPAGPARAEGEPAGDFDYYVMALSWQPGWCDREGRARGAEGCDPGDGLGWILHGLWPQYEAGWPSYCPTPERNPSRAETAAMADIMGSGGLAWHQWNKHGRCTGLSAARYFALSREAYGGVVRPPAFRRLDGPVRLPARVVEAAFLEANPGLEADMLTVTCTDGDIHEVRICLDRALSPRRCAADVRRDCTAERARMVPLP